MMNVIEATLKLAHALNVTDISKLPGPWHYIIDDHWQVAINGKENVVRFEPAECMAVNIQPYEIAVWFNGWLAGSFSFANGGLFAAGAGGNEKAYCAAIEAAIESEIENAQTN